MMVNFTLSYHYICHIADKFNSIFAQTRYCLKIYYQKYTALQDAVVPPAVRCQWNYFNKKLTRILQINAGCMKKKAEIHAGSD